MELKTKKKLKIKTIKQESLNEREKEEKLTKLINNINSLKKSQKKLSFLLREIDIKISKG
jgi:hypothetical protein